MTTGRKGWPVNSSKWGVKRRCQECGVRFYDLKRTKVVCPHCHAPFKSDAQPKAKRAIATPAKADPPPPEETADKRDRAGMSAEDQAIKEFGVDIPADSLDSDGDDDVEKNAFEDITELGEDEDNVAEVIDGSSKTDEI